MTVGVLSLHNATETRAMLNAIEDPGHEPAWLREENPAATMRAIHKFATAATATPSPPASRTAST